MDKTAQLIAGVLIVSFVIERITATMTFFLDQPAPDRKRKILLVFVTGVLAALAVWKTDIRVLRDGMQITTHPRGDLLLTWLVLVAGADRIRDFIAPGVAKPEKGEKVYEVDTDGTLRDAKPINN